MALGNYNQGDSNQKKGYEPVLYSQYNTSNRQGIDPSALSYQFYGGLLKISISPMKLGVKAEDTLDIWDHENSGSIYLPHTKARMLIDEIKYVLNHPDDIYNGGVPAGNALISFSTGKELGADGPCLIIRRLDVNTGEPTSSYAYQFKTDHYFGIRNFNPKDPINYMKQNYPNLEIEMFVDLLEQYSTYSCGAASYLQMYAQRFDTSRMNTKIGLIMDKLGIENKPEYSKKGNYGGSFFAKDNNQSFNNSDSSMRSNTLEGIEQELDN